MTLSPEFRKAKSLSKTKKSESSKEYLINANVDLVRSKTYTGIRQGDIKSNF